MRRGMQGPGTARAKRGARARTPGEGELVWGGARPARRLYAHAMLHVCAALVLLRMGAGAASATFAWSVVSDVDRSIGLRAGSDSGFVWESCHGSWHAVMYVHRDHNTMLHAGHDSGLPCARGGRCGRRAVWRVRTPDTKVKKRSQHSRSSVVRRHA